MIAKRKYAMLVLALAILPSACSPAPRTYGPGSNATETALSVRSSPARPSDRATDGQKRGRDGKTVGKGLSPIQRSELKGILDEQDEIIPEEPSTP